MNYWQHSKINLALASTISLIVYFQHSHLFSYVEFVLGPFSMKDFWLGCLICTFLITSDLDSDTSLVTKLWGPLKFIWSPFHHRNVLHHPGWGPFILISVVGVPLHYLEYGLPAWTIIGMIVMIWSHIIVDMIDSKVKKVF